MDLEHQQIHTTIGGFPSHLQMMRTSHSSLLLEWPLFHTVYTIPQSSKNILRLFFFFYNYILLLKFYLEIKHLIKVFIMLQTQQMFYFTFWYFANQTVSHAGTFHGRLCKWRCLAGVRAVEVISLDSTVGDTWSIQPGPGEPQKTQKGQREIAAWKQRQIRFCSLK